MNRWLMALLAAAFGLGLGAGFAWLTRESPPEPGRFNGQAQGAQVGDRRPDFLHASLDGPYLGAGDFDGTPVLVNFWATWCAPCVREMPLLQDTAADHEGRLKVVGIAIDEPGSVHDFVEELGITYPILIGTIDVMDTSRNFGNQAGALPYTVLVDAEGIIRWQHLGEVTEAMLDEVLADWL